MKAALITVAGLSSRFAQSVGRDVLKCVYHEGDPSQTLIARLLRQVCPAMDKVIVVGGHRFGDLEAYISDWDAHAAEDAGKVELVYNPHYADLASGYSLYAGIEALDAGSLDSLLFIEGDLYLDDDALARLANAQGDAITVSPDPIEASKSVALYFDADGVPRYVYDTSHGLLSIPEPFRSVHSSGQVWRFGDADRLMQVAKRFADKGGAGTNLEIVGPYFAESDPSKLEVVPFKEWVNCNTVQDWSRAFRGRETRRAS